MDQKLLDMLINLGEKTTIEVDCKQEIDFLKKVLGEDKTPEYYLGIIDGMQLADGVLSKKLIPLMGYVAGRLYQEKTSFSFPEEITV